MSAGGPHRGAVLTVHLRLASRSIDPLARFPPGQYADHLVGVVREDPPDGSDEPFPPIVRTEHFCLRRRGRRVEVGHWLCPEQLDNDLTGMLADELFAPGWLSGVDVFERVFTGVVRSCVDEPLPAWSTFYRNTMRRIRECWDGTPGQGAGSIAGFAPVYRRALRLVPAGSVLDLGSCFGFLALLLAGRAVNTVTASDLSAGSMRLLDTIADERGARLSTLVCDAARVPLPDQSVDTVTAIHLLEHLEPQHSLAVLREAVRLARRRVVAAVPFDDEPADAYGHVRRFDAAALAELGRRSGRRFAVDEYHGGWLVINVA